MHGHDQLLLFVGREEGGSVRGPDGGLTCRQLVLLLCLLDAQGCSKLTCLMLGQSPAGFNSFLRLHAVTCLLSL